MRQVNKIDLIILSVFLLTGFFFSLADAFQNTTNSLSIGDAQIYQIRRLQIEHKCLKIEDLTSLQQIEALEHEAQVLFDQNQTTFALLILDEIDDLISLISVPEMEQAKVTPDSVTNSLKFDTAVLLGLDSWQQKFELNYGDSDTVLSENSMNPFAGIQFDLEYTKKSYSLTANSLLKKSRDYFSTIQDTRFTQSLTSTTELNLNNYFDWTHFSLADYVSYFQNKFSAGILTRPFSNLRLILSDEIRLRKYEIQRYEYAHYFQNELKLALESGFAWQQRAGMTGRWQQRRHLDFREKDFTKITLNFSGDFSLPFNAGLRIFNDLTQKKYATQNIDTLYQSNYWENWATGQFTLPFTRFLALEVNDNFTIRNYASEFSYLRDNVANETEALFRIQAAPNITFRAGYYVDFYINHENATAEDVDAQVENYYSHGPSFSLDYFYQKFLLNLSNTSRNRVYPKAQDIDNLTLYSDRNLKSLFLFISWEINPAWEMNLITNYDADHDRENENSDSRSTIFSLEIIRNF